MGAGGIPNRAINIFEGRKLDDEGEPNTRPDLYQNGKLKQSGWYGPDGKAVRNRDYFHQDSHHNHKFPHDHNWNWANNPPRDPNWVEPDYKNFN